MKNNTQYPDKIYVTVKNKEEFNRAIRFAMKYIPARSNSGHFISKYWAKQKYSENVDYITFIWSNKMNYYITNIHSSNDEKSVLDISNEFVEINNVLDELKI